MFTDRWNGAIRNISMVAVGLILGLLLILAWQPDHGDRAADVNPGSDKVWLGIERLEVEQRELRDTLVMLRQEVAERQQAAAANTDRLQDLQVELDRQQLLAGLTAVQGPGVLVILDDSDVLVPGGADPNAYIIHEYDLRDIVNLLWMAGSEAVSINDERLVSDSSVYCLGSTVMVNNTRLSPPYSVRAIGNPKVQQDYLRNPSYLKKLKEKRRLYGLRFEVEGVGITKIPAYTGGFLVQYARLGD